MFLYKGSFTISGVIFALALALLLCNVAAAQSSTDAITHEIEDVYLAKDDGTGQAGEIVTEFNTTDVPIFCVVLLDTTEKVTVKMNFVAVDVAGVRADTKVVSASFTTGEGQNRVNFTGRPDGKWTAGKYRVDIFIDGKIARNVEFDIRKASGPDSSAVKHFRPRTQKTKQLPVKHKN
jgi:hypothetical protein